MLIQKESYEVDEKVCLQYVLENIADDLVDLIGDKVNDFLTTKTNIPVCDDEFDIAYEELGDYCYSNIMNCGKNST